MMVVRLSKMILLLVFLKTSHLILTILLCLIPFQLLIFGIIYLFIYLLPVFFKYMFVYIFSNEMKTNNFK